MEDNKIDKVKLAEGIANLQADAKEVANGYSDLINDCDKMIKECDEMLNDGSTNNNL